MFELTIPDLLRVIGQKQLVLERQAEVIAALEQRIAQLTPTAPLASADEATDTAVEQSAAAQPEDPA
jgi:hypothetical protein